MASVPTSTGEQLLDGRATRWDEHTAERRERILAAAVDLVDEVGHGVSVRDIAHAAGVPRSVVYRIFRDRDDLEAQLRAEIFARLVAVALPKLDPGSTAHSALTDAVTTYVEWVAAHPLLHHFLGTGAITRAAEGPRSATGSRSAVAQHVNQLLREAAARAGVDAALTDPVAYGVVGLIDGAVNRWVHSNPADRAPVDVLAELLTESVWAVLQSQATGLGIRLTRRTRVSALL